MEKITINELIEFREKTSEKSKKNFAFKLKNRKTKEKSDDDKSGGGNYWSISTSSIYNTFKFGKNDYYDEKIEDVEERQQATDVEKDIIMYQRNLDILSNFKEFEILNLRPDNIEKFETIKKSQKTLDIRSLPIYLNPNLVFFFERNGKKEVGALLLVPKLDGYKKSQLGMFCEVLHKFLLTHYSNDLQISEDFCITIDTYNAQKLTYEDLVKEKIPLLINQTIDEIKRI